MGTSFYLRVLERLTIYAAKQQNLLAWELGGRLKEMIQKRGENYQEQNCISDQLIMT